MAKYTDEKLQEIEHEKELKKLLKRKDVKASISALVEQGKYDEVFVNYGRQAYLRYVPGRVRREELKKFKEEGRYEDIYQKYGEAAYSKVLASTMFNEIRDEKGWFSAAFWKFKQGVKETLLSAAIFGIATTAVLPPMMGYNTTNEIHSNAENYASEINAYNERNEAYAEAFGNVEVSKLQIVMKSMDDMWNSIQGYKTPEKNITGFLELDLSTEQGYGVCRNMAADVAKRLNAIDKTFNARTLPVKMGEDGFYKIADIDRTIIEDDATVSREEGTETSTNTVEENVIKAIQSIAGNHMITLVDIPEDNIILVIDPTNPGLGMYKDGKILMFNDTRDGHSYEYDSKEISALAFTRGIEAIGEITGDLIKSFENPRLSMEELKEKYGTEAQNKALGEVRALFIARQVEKENSFNERLKVDTTKTTHEASIEQTNINQRTNDGIELEH